MTTSTQWLGLLGVTETNLAHELPFVLWTVRRRVEADRVMFGGNTYPGVILKRMQFSAFNGHTGTPEEIYAQVRNATRPSGARYYPDAQLEIAEHCAAWVLGTPREYASIPERSFYYWSPVSMLPAGSLPKWEWSNLRRYAWPGVDPWRFMAAEEIR